MPALFFVMYGLILMFYNYKSAKEYRDNYREVEKKEYEKFGM
jgi:hypothetical protein